MLCPTRELASQVAQSFRDLSDGLALKIATVFGGAPYGAQVRALDAGLDVLVATPGRLVDHLDARVANLGAVEFLVLDEVDRMLDLGFIKPIRRIVRDLPKKRQNLFFSATMPADIRVLAGELLRDPIEVAVTPVAKTADRVEHSVVFVEAAKKRDMLVELFDDAALSRVIVFTRTKRGADRVARTLDEAGVDASAIHGNKSQGQRERALGAFRSGKTRVLVATDIAARGIDIDGVTHVVNFELPDVAESYVHRIGRTARAGNAGPGDLALRPRRARSPARHRAPDAAQFAQDRPPRRRWPEARARRAQGRERGGARAGAEAPASRRRTATRAAAIGPSSPNRGRSTVSAAFARRGARQGPKAKRLIAAAPGSALTTSREASASASQSPLPTSATGHSRP